MVHDLSKLCINYSLIIRFLVEQADYKGSFFIDEPGIISALPDIHTHAQIFRQKNFQEISTVKRRPASMAHSLYMLAVSIESFQHLPGKKHHPAT